MSLTLGFFAVVLIILPGLVALARYNQRAGKAGVRRAEMPLTAISTLVAAVLISLFTHLCAWVVSDGIVSLFEAIGTAHPKLILGAGHGNPFESLYVAVAGGIVLPPEVAMQVAGAYLIEILAVMYLFGSDAFDLMMDGVDAGSHGWAYQHIIRPAEHGYTPIATVFVKGAQGRAGIAYEGPVIDVRHSSEAKILSIALARPQRFLYEAGTPSSASPMFKIFVRQRSDATGFQRLERSYVGGVIALPGEEIANLNVRVVANALINQYSDEEDAGE